MDSNNKQNNMLHSVNIINREKIEIIGVTEVISSTENEIIAKIFNSLITIFGSNMRVIKLVPEEQLLCISGKINGLKYCNKIAKKSFFEKVFK